MTRILSLFSAVFIAMGVSFAAQASLMVEPYLGYEKGTFERNNGGSGDLTGESFGGRIGISQFGLMAGGEAMMEEATRDFDDAGEADLDSSNYGVFIGYSLPLLFRAWATYFIKSSGEDDTGNEFMGTGKKIGVGFTGLPFVSLNAEYLKVKYTEDGNGNDINDISTDVYMVTASIPLSL